MEKGKTSKKVQLYSLSWLAWLFVYFIILYGFLQFVQLPTSLPVLQTMEMSLFFSSVLFLGLYSLAFILISTKDFTYREEKVARARLFIILVWGVSLLYHFFLWLMTYSLFSIHFFQSGIVLTLGAFVFTFGHFCSYFSFINREQRYRRKTKLLENRRHSYETIKEILYMHQLVLDVMTKDPEVYQMMKWNQFDTSMNQMMAEAQLYVHASLFAKADVEKLRGVQAWMENILMIIEQHPNYKGLYKQNRK